MTFDEWLDTFLEEKGFHDDTLVATKVDDVIHFMSLEVVINGMKDSTNLEKKMIKETLVVIDFRNGDVMDYFSHLAKAFV